MSEGQGAGSVGIAFSEWTGGDDAMRRCITSYGLLFTLFDEFVPVIAHDPTPARPGLKKPTRRTFQKIKQKENKCLIQATRNPPQQA